MEKRRLLILFLGTLLIPSVIFPMMRSSQKIIRPLIFTTQKSPHNIPLVIRLTSSNTEISDIDSLKSLRQEARTSASMYLATTGLTTPLLVLSRYMFETGLDMCTSIDSCLYATVPLVTIGILSSLSPLFCAKETIIHLMHSVKLTRKIKFLNKSPKAM